jgi:hypothetical protein
MQVKVMILSLNRHISKVSRPLILDASWLSGKQSVIAAAAML